MNVHPTTALVVGGSSGIGLATARALAAHGMSAHVVGRDPAKLDALRAEGLTTHRADATRLDEIEPVLAAVGPIDALVLSISAAKGAGPLAELDLALVREELETKVFGYLTTIRAALPHLAPAGSITLLGAVSARMAMAGTAGLAAVNGAVEAIVAPLARELAPIRVNGVSPGWVDTPWWSGLPADARAAHFASTAAMLPVGRIAAAEDIAACVALAATNSNMTGTVLGCDGGAPLVDPS
jgi:NAD(P)-dependent dehydrogenase (short-subunit alcohol dehydrogenase family)